jgi:hypothetical protein
VFAREGGLANDPPNYGCAANSGIGVATLARLRPVHRVSLTVAGSDEPILGVGIFA